MSNGQPQVLGLVPQPTIAVASYEERYGLAERPFASSPNVWCAYPAESYGEALHETIRALRRREGLIVITGDAGTGKTLLSRMLLQQLDENTLVSVVLDPHVTFEELLTQALRDFGVVPPGPSTQAELTRHRLLAMLQEFLATSPHDTSAIIIVDEAHALAPAVLEQIRLLLNFETDEAKLLQVVLLGQPALDDVLRRRELACIEERVARRYVLQPLSPQETKRYIERRLAISRTVASAQGGRAVPLLGSGEQDTDRVQFTPSAIRAVSAYSGGNPRTVNMLCDGALELGHQEATLTIDRRLVRRARRRLQRPARPSRLKSLPILAGAAVLFVAIPAGWFLAMAASRPAEAAPAEHVIAESAAAGPAEVSPAGHAPSLSTSPASEPAATVPPTTELPTVRSFNISVASIRGASDANVVVTRLQALGLPAFSRTQSPWQQVLVGPYRTREEAEAAQQVLAEHHYPKTRVVAREGSDDATIASVVESSHAPIGLDPVAVMLLRAGDRASVVVELPIEPRQVLTHRLDGSLLELEAGPVTLRSPAHVFVAPAGMDLVERVSVEGVDGPGHETLVRARLSVPASTGSNVRVAGRRVYIDLGPASENEPSIDAAPRVDAVVVVGGDQPESSAFVAYTRAIEPALRRFEEVEPFLLSAAAEPQTDVLVALGRTLQALGSSIKTGDVPAQARKSHEQLMSALAQAGRATEPGFRGDRVEEARRAVAGVEQVRKRLRDERLASEG